jgi:NAD(P)-dependent dehydrogenase (short-subunit alcohol dehydrogenase family)
MISLAGKRAVVTGGSRGIGQAAAIALARAGADVASLHLPDQENAAVTESGIREHGRRSIMVEGDVADRAQVEAFAARVDREWGGVDIWVNNAARILVRPFLDMTPEEWHSLLASNLHGYYYGCRAALSFMLPQRYGRIVNVGSVTDIQPIANMTAYITAKGGVVALTKSLAVEMAPHGITVNVIAPGAIETPLNVAVYTPEVRRAYGQRIAMGRLGRPEEIADAIVYLASDLSRYMTGHEMVVDGGLILNGNVGFPAEADPAGASPQRK